MKAQKLATDIEVTAADIAAGRRSDCAKCPVALALNRFTGRAWVVNGISASLIHRGIAPIRISLPPRVGHWILLFDEGARVAPFTFTTRIPKALPQ